MLARVIAYCLVGIPSSVQALLWADVFPALLPYLLGLIALESVLVIRLIYRAGVETGVEIGRKKTIRRALAQLGVDEACQLPAGAVPRVNLQDAPTISVLRHRP
jgi:hypothetical protein